MKNFDFPNVYNYVVGIVTFNRPKQLISSSSPQKVKISRRNMTMMPIIGSEMSLSSRILDNSVQKIKKQEHSKQIHRQLSNRALTLFSNSNGTKKNFVNSTKIINIANPAVQSAIDHQFLSKKSKIGIKTSKKTYFFRNNEKRKIKEKNIRIKKVKNQTIVKFSISKSQRKKIEEVSYDSEKSNVYKIEKQQSQIEQLNRYQEKYQYKKRKSNKKKRPTQIETDENTFQQIMVEKSKFNEIIIQPKQQLHYQDVSQHNYYPQKYRSQDKQNKLKKPLRKGNIKNLNQTHNFDKISQKQIQTAKILLESIQEIQTPQSFRSLRSVSQNQIINQGDKLKNDIQFDQKILNFIKLKAVKKRNKKNDIEFQKNRQVLREKIANFKIQNKINIRKSQKHIDIKQRVLKTSNFANFSNIHHQFQISKASRNSDQNIYNHLSDFYLTIIADQQILLKNDNKKQILFEIQKSHGYNYHQFERNKKVKQDNQIIDFGIRLVKECNKINQKDI